jgi:hypothetical protein
MPGFTSRQTPSKPPGYPNSPAAPHLELAALVAGGEARKGRIGADPQDGRFQLASKNPALPGQAPVAQLDRASVYETEGHRFESCRAR